MRPISWLSVPFSLFFAAIGTLVGTVFISIYARVDLFAPDEDPIPRELAERSHQREVDVAIQRGFHAGEDHRDVVVTGRTLIHEIDLGPDECVAFIASSSGGRAPHTVAIGPDALRPTELYDALSAQNDVPGLTGHVQWCASSLERVALIVDLGRVWEGRAAHDTKVHWSVLRAPQGVIDRHGGINRGWVLRPRPAAEPYEAIRPIIPAGAIVPPGGALLARHRRHPRILAGSTGILVAHERATARPHHAYSEGDACTWDDTLAVVPRPIPAELTVVDGTVPDDARNCRDHASFAVRLVPMLERAAAVVCNDPGDHYTCALRDHRELHAPELVLPSAWRRPRDAEFAWSLSTLFGIHRLDTGIGLTVIRWVPRPADTITGDQPTPPPIAELAPGTRRLRCGDDCRLAITAQDGRATAILTRRRGPALAWTVDRDGTIAALASAPDLPAPEASAFELPESLRSASLEIGEVVSSVWRGRRAVAWEARDAEGWTIRVAEIGEPATGAEDPTASP